MTNQNNGVVQAATDYRIYDEVALSATLRAIKEVQEEKDIAKAQYDEAIAHLNTWYKERTDKLDKEIQFRESQAIDYHERVLVDNPKKKTLDTPFGKVKSTTRKATFTKPDSDVLLAVLESNGLTDYIKTKTTTTADWVMYKKTLTIVGENVVDETGVILEDVEIEQAATTFKVEVL